MKRLIALALALCMVLCVIPAASAAETPASLDLGTYDITVPYGQSVTYTFTPADSGRYALSYPDGGLNLYFELDVQITNATDIPTNPFVCGHHTRGWFVDLTAGTTYTFTMTNCWHGDVTQEITFCPANTKLESAAFTKESIIGFVGEGADLQIDLNPVDAVCEDITWASADTSVATVATDYEYGATFVKFVGEGETTVTATFSGGTVLSIPVKTLAVTDMKLDTTYNNTPAEMDGMWISNYTFTPAETGYYAFSSQAFANLVVCDSGYMWITEGFFDDRQNLLVVKLEKDETYRLSMQNHTEDFGTLRVEKALSVAAMEITKAPTIDQYIPGTNPHWSLLLEGMELKLTMSDGSTQSFIFDEELAADNLTDVMECSFTWNGLTFLYELPYYDGSAAAGEVWIACCDGEDSYDINFNTNYVDTIQVVEDEGAMILENTGGWYDDYLGGWLYAEIEGTVGCRLVLEATFADGTTQRFTTEDHLYGNYISFAHMECQEINGLWTPGGTNEMTIDFAGAVCTYNVKIVKNDITGIKVTNGLALDCFGDPEKGTFDENGGFDFANVSNQEQIAALVFEVTHADGTVDTVTADDFTWRSDGMPFYMGCEVVFMFASEDPLLIDKPQDVEMTLLWADQTADFIWSITCSHYGMTKTEAKAASCTADGCAAYYTCSLCDKIFADEAGTTETTAEKQVIKGGHKLTEVKAKDATYTAAGNTAYYTCSGCTKLFADAAGKTETTLAAVTVPQLIKVKDTSASVSTGAVDNAISNAASTGNVVLDLNEVAAGSTSGSETPAAVTSAELPVASLGMVAKISEEATLTVSMADATVVLDAATLTAVADQADGATVTLEVKQVKAETLNDAQQEAIEDLDVHGTVSAAFLSGDKYIHDFDGGKATVAVPFTLPVGVKGEDIVVIYVADDGKTEEVPTTFANNVLMFTVEHFSEYVIVNTAAEAPTTNGSPATGDVSILNSVAAMLLSGMGVIALVPKKRQEV